MLPRPFLESDLEEPTIDFCFAILWNALPAQLILLFPFAFLFPFPQPISQARTAQQRSQMLGRLLACVTLLLSQSLSSAELQGSPVPEQMCPVGSI